MDKNLPSNNLAARDSRLSIGIFDSGVGGLTVLSQLRHLLPQEDFLYFGDTARVPYGGKSRDTIVRYSVENTIFLMQKGIKLLVVACNTAAAFASPSLSRIFNVPVVSVIQPGIHKAAASTTKGRIGVIGTQATIRSQAYQKGLQELLPHAHIAAQACPLLVPLVEERYAHHPATRLIIRDYLAPLKACDVDTLILGCTHYPLLQQAIQEEMGEAVTLINSAAACADSVAGQLDLLNIRRQEPANGLCRFFVSDDPDKFQSLGRELLGHPIEALEQACPLAQL